jgi:DNA repair protein RadC
MQQKSNKIKNWSEDDRPREKLALKGIDALSNSELLAIIINNGTKDKSAVDVCKELLLKCNNSLHTLSKLSVEEIIKLKVKGIGNAKAISILTALQLSLRKESEILKKEKINSASDAALFFKNLLQHKTVEQFIVMFLNTANHVISFDTLSIGGISGTVVDTRVVLRKAMEKKASKIILCHNHPSGNLNPSVADKQITAQITEAAKYHNIEVLDHLIVSEEGYYSLTNDEKTLI